MLRNLMHIWMILVVGLASPTASVVRLSCADSGATTMTMCTFENECASDPCCPEEIPSEAMSADCCRTTVFTLTSTSPMPALFTAVAPVRVSSLLPAATGNLVSLVEAHAPSILLTRNLPLLV
jgi:hypothetical protein